MASFNVNESLFVLDLDDTAPSILPVGEMLPDGITIEVDRDRGENYAFYVSADGKYDILAARPELAERWIQEGYLEKRIFIAFAKSVLDLKTAGIRNSEAAVLQEVSCLVLKNARAHARVQIAPKPAGAPGD